MNIAEEFSAWVEIHPSKKAWVLLGDWYLELSQLPLAGAAFRNALLIDPMSPAAHEGLGLVKLAEKQISGALEHFQLSDRFRPRHAPTLNHWGLAYLEQGNVIEASKRFEQAIEADHNSHHAWHNLGLTSLQSGAASLGISYFRRALAIKPDSGLAYSNLALALRDAEDISAALDAAQKAIDLKPSNARGFVIGADIATDAGMFDLASARVAQALILEPHSIGAHIASAKLFTQTGNYSNADQQFDHALALDPNNAEALGGKGQLELLLGNWHQGWSHYEGRRRTQPPSVRQFGLQYWEGVFRSGQHLLVYAEQGVGDILLFSSCIPQLLRDARQVDAVLTIETYPRLARLLEASFPGVRVIGREATQSGVEWLSPLGCTHECPVGSLPLWYRSHDSDFPMHNGYLIAPPERIEIYRSKLANRFGSRPVVGITWRGGLLRSASLQRSINLRDLLEAFHGMNAGLVALQHGDIAADLQTLNTSDQDRLYYAPEFLSDFSDAAALTMAVDAVVTVCNTQAHLTGALGRPGVVLVPQNPNWRYGTSGSTTPWYPSLHLVRQCDGEGWRSAIKEAGDWLRNRGY